MEIQQTKVKNSIKLCLVGRLDGNTSSYVESEFQKLVEQGETQFIFDFSALSYISSAGLRAVLIAAKKTKAMQGKLAFIHMDDNVKEVFDISGFSKILSIYPTEEEALKAFQ